MVKSGQSFAISRRVSNSAPPDADTRSPRVSSARNIDIAQSSRLRYDEAQVTAARAR